MSYLVLARKWRPQTFADMTGQEHVVRTLANAIARDRVAHAYLFCGPRGVGKTTAARLLAKALNCEKGPTATPCGTCQPCVEIAAGSSIDVAEIDGASNNGVENVREIRENARYLPSRDRNKIYIIDEVHMLTGAAFNALLKTLEEPPPHVKFIFATTEPHKLPDTILSRCQRHNFRRIPTAMMFARLKEILTAEKANLTDRSIALVVRQSEGGMRDALSLLDQILSACGPEPTDDAVAEAMGAVDRTQVHRLCKAVLERDGKEAMGAIEEVYIRGVDLKRLAEEVALYFRHVLVTKITKEPPDELAEVERKAVLELASTAEAVQISRAFDIAHATATEMVRSAQPRLFLEVALLKAIHLAPGAPLAELVTKLDAITSKLGNGGASMAGVRAPVNPGGTFRPVASASPATAAPAPPTVASPPPPRPPVPLPAEASRVFAVDSSPGGCATGECLEPPAAAAPSAAPEAPRAIAPAAEAVDAPPPEPDEAVEPEPLLPLGKKGGDDPTKPNGDRWKMVLSAVKRANPRLADSLSHGRLAWLRPGEVAIAFTGPQASFHRMQAEAAIRKGELVAIFTEHFAVSTSLRIEADAQAAETTASPAEEAEARRRAREERLKQSTRDHPAVQAAMSLFGGTLQDVRVREEIRRPELADEAVFEE